MSRSNYDKPFYVDIGTSIAAVRCASNHDVVYRRDHILYNGAIKEVEELCDRLNKECELFLKTQAALAIPPRNGEVGTAKEQAERFEHYCYANRTRERCCLDCPLVDEPSCEIAWAQMPYDEEAQNA